MAKKKAPTQSQESLDLEASIIAYIYGLAERGKEEVAGISFYRQPILMVTAKSHHRILMRRDPEDDKIVWMATIKFRKSWQEFKPILVSKFGDMEVYNKDLTILRLYLP